ncbi:hypothetical protein DFJ58DRAFT_843134 [Suillus subalutaceus]|uniref:uncharacterized protein n=1 Tax=Suillus subalutaceus TaxID=48586 RepID=UPI001B861AEE|nr:uncharacterized protein DFJ58DRAFT_843134 [Suillus subalutaceus]KAG1847691.1 hypothetical protein DFJ58DRAFT_843134 [Suillus subalutaceus]
MPFYASMRPASASLRSLRLSLVSRSPMHDETLKFPASTRRLNSAFGILVSLTYQAIIIRQQFGIARHHRVLGIPRVVQVKFEVDRAGTEQYSGHEILYPDNKKMRADRMSYVVDGTALGLNTCQPSPKRTGVVSCVRGPNPANNSKLRGDPENNITAREHSSLEFESPELQLLISRNPVSRSPMHNETLKFSYHP